MAAVKFDFNEDVVVEIVAMGKRAHQLTKIHGEEVIEACLEEADIRYQAWEEAQESEAVNAELEATFQEVEAS